MADTIIVRECLHGQVRVMYGDLTKEEGDVLVTPANNRLQVERASMKWSIKPLVPSFGNILMESRLSGERRICRPVVLARQW